MPRHEIRHVRMYQRVPPRALGDISSATDEAPQGLRRSQGARMPRQSGTSPQPGRPRHLRPDGLFNLRNGAFVACLVVVGAVATLLGRNWGQGPGTPAADCKPAILHVGAAPDVAPVLTQLAARTSATTTRGGDGCNRLLVTVSAQDPAAALQAFDSAGTRPDGWIPDSSLWLRRLSARSQHVAHRLGSVAYSPVVVAVSPARAAGTFATLAASDLTSNPTLWGIPNPSNSAVGVGALLGLQTALGS